MRVFFICLSVWFAIPFAGAQWVQTNGPLGGGNVSSLIVYGENILAGTNQNGVFISTDIGVSWLQVNYDFSGIGPRQFIISGDYILVGTGDGMYRSSDGGYTWSEANIGMPSYRSIEAMTVSETHIIAVTSFGSYFVSENNGATWKGVSLAQTVPNALAVSGNFLFAGTYSGIMRSQDNGASWIEVNNGLTDLQVRALAVIDSTLIAGTYQGAIFTSNDNGSSWTKVKMGLPDVTALTVSGSILYVISSSGLFRSMDYGATLTSINSGLPGSPAVISLAANGLNLFAGLDGGGVYYSGYGGNSWRATTGLPCTEVKSLTVNNATIFAGTIGYGLFKSIDNGNEWTKSGNGIPDWLSIQSLAADANNVYAGTSGGLYKSGNDGDLWTESLPGYQVQALTISGSAIYAGAYYGGVFRSVNEGGSWTQLNNGLPGPPVIAIAVSGSTLFAGTYGSGAYRSTDNGNSWIPVNSGLNDNVVSSFAVFGSTVLAGTYSGIYITHNNGTLWTQVAYGGVSTLAVYGSVLFAGSNSGASMSADTGKTWTIVNEGLARGIQAFAFSGTNVFAGTSGNGVYINSALLTGADDEIAAVAQEVCVYPNPASNTITIETPGLMSVSFLSICNINGQEMLRQGITGALTTLDISILPAGLYIVRYGNGVTIHTGRFIKA